MQLNIKDNLLQYTQGQKFIDFNKKLITTKNEILGVKIPQIRVLAKSVKEQDVINLLKIKENDSFEEVLFKGFLLGKIKDEKALKKEILNFLPFVDNWATCDTVVSSLKQLKKENNLFDFFVTLTQDNREYYARFGFVTLKCYYLTKQNICEICECIIKNKSENYYTQMAKAWLIAEMSINFEFEVLSLLKSGKLSKFVINKSISKTRESFRVRENFKQELLNYKV